MQISYLRNADPGFSKDAVLMVPIQQNDKGKTDYLRNTLRSDATIKNVSFCYRAPSSTADAGGSIKYDTHD
jgi:putative ABC transport system permease protein